MSAPRPEHAIVHAVALLHERGLEGVRIRANFYATGHWRCRVYVPAAGDDPDLERDVVLAYTNGRQWDVFGDGRTRWDASSLADEFERLAEAHPDARRSDPAYASWLREVRERTDGGAFSMYEDFYTPEQDWQSRRQVRLLPRDGTPADAHDAQELVMPVPPPPLPEPR